MTPLRIESQVDGNERQILVYGEIDASTADEFRSALTADSTRRLVVDLRECSFMDLAGLRCLEGVRSSGSLTLIPSPQVWRLLELTDTTHLFRIETEGFDGEEGGQGGSTSDE